MRLTRAAALGAALLTTGALGVSVASALVDEGDPTQPPSLVAVPGSAQIDQTAPDPGGGLAWAVRLYDSESGGECSELGRLNAAGEFGRVDPSGQFAALALDQGGTCGSLAAEPAIVGISDYPAGPARPARTVLFGRVSPQVTEIAVTPSGQAEVSVATGPGGAFVLARAGPLPPTALPVRMALTGGGTLEFDWQH